MSIIGSKKEYATNLRKLGQSYREISEKLDIAKSTLSYWFKDNPELADITRSNISRSKKIWSDNISRYNRLRSDEYIKNRISEIDKYSSEIKPINKNELFALGMGLYLAEGGKSEKHNLRFANSDPSIVSMMLRFLREICEVDQEKIFARIHLYQEHKYEDSLLFWSIITGIEMDKFWQPQLLVTSSSKRTKKVNKLEHGTLHLTVCDTSINKMVYGWMKGIKLQFVPR